MPRIPAFAPVCVLVACGGTPARPPAAALAPAPEPVAAAVEPEVEEQALDPEPEPEPPRDPEKCAQLVNDGRKIQRERGEGGAEDAIAAYTAALAADHECAAALWELGWSHQVLDRWDDAVASWDQLTALDPAYPELEKFYPIAIMRRDQAAALAALPEPGALPEPETEPRPGPTVTFNAVGDVHMGYAWPERRAKLPPNNAGDLFKYVEEKLNDADVTFGNLETVLADDGPSTKCGPRSTKCFSFRVPKAFADTLAKSFDVMSIANNHTGDFGQYGRKETIDALDGVGIHHSGPVGDIASFEHEGLRIGLIAFSTGGGVYRVQDIDTAMRVVADVDRTHDLVIVSFHGGAEGSRAAHVPEGTEMFLGENRGNLRKFSRSVIDAGADLVLGHGPHRLRGAELYKGRLIAYSLGNFSTWDTFSLRGPLGITAILNVTLAANGVATQAELWPLTIEDPGRPKPDPKGQAIDLVRTLSKQDFGDPLFTKEGRWTLPLPPGV